MKKRIVSFLFIIFILFIGYANRDMFLPWIKEGGVLSIFISILAVAIGAFFPIIPFPILGGIIGAVFGFWPGICISLTGAMLGTITIFLLVRYGFRDAAQAYVNKYERIKKYEIPLFTHSFLAVCLSRFIPFIPAVIVNIMWALSRVKWLTFFLASALGKIPNIIMVNFAGANFSQNKMLSILLYLAYMAAAATMNSVIFFKRGKLVKND